MELLLNTQNDLTAARLNNAFKKTALDLGEEGRDDFYGWGLFDYKATINYLLNPFYHKIGVYD